MAVLVHRLSVHTKDVNCCSFSSNSKLLASVSGDKTVRLWDVEEGRETDFSPLTGHSYHVTSCAFSPFGTVLASCSQDCSVVLWNSGTGEKITTLQGHKGGVRCCSFSANSHYLATASADETICIWEMNSKQLLRVLKGTESMVVTCRFSPDNLYVLSGSSNGDLRIWDVQDGKCRAFVMAHDGGLSGVGVTGCDFSPTFGSADSLRSCGNGESPHFLIASCGGDNLVKLWDLYTASAYSDRCHIQQRFVLSGHQGQVWDCKFSTNGKLLASWYGFMLSQSLNPRNVMAQDSDQKAAPQIKNVILWDPIGCNILLTVSGHTRYVTTVAFSPNGLYLATGSNDRTVQIWKLSMDHAGTMGIFDKDSSTVSTGNQVERTQKKRMVTWTTEDVSKWLEDLALQQYIETFRENAIDGNELVQLNSEVLSHDLGVVPLGHRNKILRQIKQVRSEELDGHIPDEFLCPVTREVMSDPVIASDGFSYERSSITAWIESGKKTSPMTNSPLASTVLTPNRSLKNAILRFFETNPFLS